ncbi:MAG: SDR family oxidoreductase [Candidatus Omnitrophica bacterium]|nr:SDR family oxidoreductase [Candidatus Omnitrophota bacterium]
MSSSQFQQGKTALVTGASGGIGYELAKLLAQDGYSLVLVARSREKLEQIARDLERAFSISIKIITKDLSQPQAAEEIFQELERESIPIDILINNAGFGHYGFFSEIDWKRQEEMIALNVTALAHLTQLFLSGMMQRKQGRILNVASTSAFQPGPLMAVYYATKAYVLSFSEAIANELKNTGVTVTCLCPGATSTDFQKNAVMGNNWLFKLNLMKADVVARIGYQGLMKGKTLVIPGWTNWLGAFLVRFGPRKMVPEIVRMIQQSR